MSDTKRIVREHYGAAAKRPQTGCCGGDTDPITVGLYSAEERDLVPKEAVGASFGCGNPTALAELREGETVLDLGSGGGIDVLLSARRVGPSGFAYGLDMTDEMLELAERNRREAGLENVKFLKGEIEDIPLPEAHVDVVISNCVINLSPDKGRVLREVFRVLKPGGRFAVADIVADTDLPEKLRADMLAWAGCVAGALSAAEYEEKLRAAGFERIEIVPTRRFRLDDLRQSGCCSTMAELSEEEVRAIDGKVYSAFVRAVKPS